MKILIIDDDISYIQRLKMNISSYFESLDDEISFDTFTTYAGIDNLSNFYDLCFVDIDLDGQNGIFAAKEIKENHICQKIIFVSFHDHLIFDSLIIQPYYFLRKSAYEIDLKMLFNLFKNDFKTKNMIEIHSTEGNYIIGKEDIIYIEASGRKVSLTTFDKQYEDNKLLKDFILYIGTEIFVQTHRSYYVNIFHVAGYSAENVLMDNGDKVPLSRSYKNPFLLKYREKLLC